MRLEGYPGGHRGPGAASVPLTQLGNEKYLTPAHAYAFVAPWT